MQPAEVLAIVAWTVQKTISPVAVVRNCEALVSLLSKYDCWNQGNQFSLDTKNKCKIKFEHKNKLKSELSPTKRVTISKKCPKSRTFRLENCNEQSMFLSRRCVTATARGCQAVSSDPRLFPNTADWRSERFWVSNRRKGVSANWGEIQNREWAQSLLSDMYIAPVSKKSS